MKNTYPRLLLSTVFSAALGLGAAPAGAEDIDLFVSSQTNSAQNPNILFVIENSSNWSRNDQGWPVGKQGEAELRSMYTLLGEVGSDLNIGLMLFTTGTGSTPSGSYPRFHIRQMTSTNKDALKELIGTSTCAAGNNSLNGTANCILKDFGDTRNKIGTNVDYSRALFEVFKYFGGHSSPALANNANPNPGSPQDSTHFGPLRYSGDPDAQTDTAAFVTGGTTTWKSPLGTTNSCAKNYVIFIANGFPNQDDTNGTLLAGVGGTTTQLAMPTYSTSKSGTSITLGTDPICHTNAECVTAASTITSYQGYPVSGWNCTSQTGTTSTGCTTGKSKNLLIKANLGTIAALATGSSAVPASNKVNYADEWAKFMFTTDVNAAEGRQFIQTYTIDVFKDKTDTDQSALLASMAKYGGGKYFQAKNEAEILDAMRKIMIEIQSLNSVFASASLPINATNRSQNENQVFIGMFRPDGQARPRWYGNLKRYQIALIDNQAKLADKFGVDAVDTRNTGFITPCATSFWTSDTSAVNSATPAQGYWEFLSTGASACTTSGIASKFSDAPDGPTVEKGATAEVVRKGNNPTTTDTTPTWALNRTLYTCPDYATCNFTPTAMHTFNDTNVTAAAVGAVTTAEHAAIINYTRGNDIDAENLVSTTGDTSSTNDVRSTVHGDVAHSRPLPVNYGGTTGVVLYYGANDGTFRAVSGQTGKELWAFFAPEHHTKLKRLKDNSPNVFYPGETTVSGSQRKDYFFDGSAGLYQTFNSDNTANTVWVFSSMRRGGRMLYAFDVSNPAAPLLKWRQGCPSLTTDTDCTTGYTAIGQTWSIPNVAFIKGHSTTAPVIIMGGGYDTCEDTELVTVSTAICATTKGNRVYVINASSGAVIKELTTDRAVVGDVTLVDRDFDGLVDHAYAADMGGNLYRVDFVDPSNVNTTRASGAWTITKIARTNVTAAGRKFLFGPAVLPTTDKMFLSITSGDRERPLVTNYPYVVSIQNRAYMFVDRFQTSGLPVNLDGDTMNNFTSATECTTTLASGKPDGWFFDLLGGRGEQGVTSNIIFGGLVFFSTNRPLTGLAASCSANLGEARGYAVNLLNASGAVGTQAICGGTSRSNTFTGGGLPPSPVTGTVPVGDRQVTIMIGGIDRSGASSSAIGSQRVKPAVAQTRVRTYWYKKGDQ